MAEMEMEIRNNETTGLNTSLYWFNNVTSYMSTVIKPVCIFFHDTVLRNSVKNMGVLGVRGWKGWKSHKKRRVENLHLQIRQNYGIFGVEIQNFENFGLKYCILGLRSNLREIEKFGRILKEGRKPWDRFGGSNPQYTYGQKLK